ncbi:MAG: DUF2029 domain-containing protein [Chloroflexi bacterium]|nr:DUF2029 domain-containing protein [Chloroflexota bacterium]
MLHVLCVVLLAGLFMWQSFYEHAADFKSFFSAGYAVRHPEIPLYDLIALDENPFGEVFKLAPPAAVYLVPVSFGTIQQARLMWRLVLVASILLAYGLLLRAFDVGTLGWSWLAGLALWLQFGPLQIAVGEGQWDPAFLLVIVLATIGVMRSRYLLASVALALAGSIKPYPLLLAGWFLARRQWTALVVTGLAFVGLLALGSAIVGLDEVQAFFLRVLPASGATTAYADNQSLGGVLARLATSDLKPFPLKDTPVVDLAIRGLAVVLGGLTVWLVARSPAEEPLSRALQLSLFVPLSILVIPAAWTHYQAILLVPLTVLAVEQARHRPHDWPGWAVLATLYAVLLLPNPTMLYGAEIDRNLWLRSRADAANLALQRLYPTEVSRLILSYKALAVLGLFGLLAWRVARQPATLPAASPEASTTRQTARALS